MKYFELDKDEEELLEAVENGEWLPTKNQAEATKEAIEIAKNTLSKTKNINLRLSEKDVQKLKAQAAKKGLPYQTYAASILHQYASE